MSIKTYTLSKAPNAARWELRDDETNSVLVEFRTREQAMARRIIERVIGNSGVVKVSKANGTLSKTLTFPLRNRR